MTTSRTVLAAGLSAAAVATSVTSGEGRVGGWRDAEGVIGPGKGRTRWLCPPYRFMLGTR